ncbi:hypothetical protein [Campylobacter coli]|uniref:hypothetical protein n=1 Tax=Campylobacter coli TaxID=195 RepID=UPI0011A670B2|nr:hypothetical protein [Campylobacter coli]
MAKKKPTIIKEIKMTQEQFNEIKERLAKWRKKSRLTYKYHRERFFEYILENESLYFKAKSDFDRIKSLVNIYIFLLNSINVNYKLYRRVFIGNSFKDGEFNIKTLVAATAEYMDTHKVMRDVGLIPSESQAAYIMCGIENMFKHLSFDLHKCIIEKLKEIENQKEQK